MHGISEEIERTGKAEIMCPRCFFTWDVVEVWNAVAAKVSVKPIIARWLKDPINKKCKRVFG